jgi:hypothetical protein
MPAEAFQLMNENALFFFHKLITEFWNNPGTDIKALHGFILNIPPKKADPNKWHVLVLHIVLLKRITI